MAQKNLHKEYSKLKFKIPKQSEDYDLSSEFVVKSIGSIMDSCNRLTNHTLPISVKSDTLLG